MQLANVTSSRAVCHQARLSTEARGRGRERHVAVHTSKSSSVKVEFFDENGAPRAVVEAARGDFLERTLKSRAAYELFEGIFGCKSQGQCGMCTVLVRSGSELLTPKEPFEEKFHRFSPTDGKAMRLACQVRILPEGACAGEDVDGASYGGGGSADGAGEDEQPPAVIRIQKVILPDDFV